MPKIVEKTYEELLDESLSLAASYVPEWRPAEGDMGLALLKLFAHMKEDIATRLNRVPDKGFAAFLDMLGMRLSAAKPSSVPLTFFPAKGLSGGSYVPAGTLAASEETEDREALSFETLKSLTVTSASLVKVMGVNPERDHIFDHTDDIDSLRGFWPFEGSNVQDHILYIGHGELFEAKAGSSIRLRIDGVSSDEASGWSWMYSSESVWLPLSAKADSQDIILLPDTDIAKSEIGGIETCWISANVNPLTRSYAPMIADLKIVDKASSGDVSLVPDMGCYNFLFLDIEKRIFPFGNKPRTHDMFYIACEKAFKRPGANVTIAFERSKDPEKEPVPRDVVISPEYWNGRTWRSLSWTENVDLNGLVLSPVEGDQTRYRGEVVFQVPDDFLACDVNGEEGYWIRLHLSQGNYGQEMVVPVKNDIGDITGYILKEDFFPPWIDDVLIGYDYSGGLHPPEHMLLYNQLEFKEPVFPFKPFSPIREKSRTLLLGFDQPLEGGNLSIFLHILPLKLPGVKLSWSYWGSAPNLSLAPAEDTLYLTSVEGLGVGMDLLIEEGEGASRTVEGAIIDSMDAQAKSVHLNIKLQSAFTGDARILRRISLEAEDNTRYLTESDTLEFLAPKEHASVSLLGSDCYWLMAVPTSSSTGPMFLGIYPNTTWAEQMETVSDEVMGSSSGEADQAFSALKKPVISPDLWIKEGIVYSQEEKADLASEGLSWEEVKDEQGKASDTWVEWADVDDFQGSGPFDRQYVLDGAMGEVFFGDGKRGKIPPIGTDNIRISYRSGGGSAGNLSAGEVNVLKTLVPGISRVENLVSAEGGSDAEDMESVMERGPGLLKALDRAVTYEDFQRLSKASSSAIARTVCISDNGLLKVIVIPKGAEDRPEPSPGLLRIVRSYLEERCLSSLSPGELAVVSPSYVEVRISAVIVPTSQDIAVLLERQIIAALKEYLHPLTGGGDGQGWDFGRDVHLSDLYAFIAENDGVDHVTDLTINESVDDLPIGDLEMVCSGEHSISMSLGGSV